jgi:hypothetical protein
VRLFRRVRPKKENAMAGVARLLGVAGRLGAAVAWDRLTRPLIRRTTAAIDDQGALDAV